MARVECECCGLEMEQEHAEHRLCISCGENVCDFLEGFLRTLWDEAPWWIRLAPVSPPDSDADPGYCEDCGFPYALVLGPWRDSGIDVIYTDCCSECGTWWCLTPPVLPFDEPTYRLAERCAAMGPEGDLF